MAKPTVVSQFVSLKEAAQRFDDPDNLLRALQDGTLAARGRYSADYTDDRRRLAEPTPIPSASWHEAKADFDLSQLINDDESCFHVVEIERIALDTLAATGVTKNTGGRPPKHDWDQFWREVIIAVHEDGIPPKLDQWVRQLQAGLPSLTSTSGGGPDESQIRKKLQPVFKQLKKASTPRNGKS